MTIQNLKELESLLKVCRKHGVRSIEIDGIKMLIESNDSEPKEAQKEQTQSNLPGLTDEDIMLWSSAPL